MEEGHPVPLDVSITYTLEDSPVPTLTIRHSASLPQYVQGDAEAVANLTIHSYFNLDGYLTPNPDIRQHTIITPSETVLGTLELNDVQIPTGILIPIENVQALDFRVERTLGSKLDQVMKHKGYDHFYMLKSLDGVPSNNNQIGGMRVGGVLFSKESGIKMTFRTDAFGFQLYTGNWLDGSINISKASQLPVKEDKTDGPTYAHIHFSFQCQFTSYCRVRAVYGEYSGVCLEPSAPPDAINSPHPAIRESVIVRRNKPWIQTSSFSFQIPK
jgi:galactose mutarotase-like enzyme